MARGRSGRAARSPQRSLSRDPILSVEEMLRPMSDPLIQEELVRQQNYFNTEPARRHAELMAALNEIQDTRRHDPTTPRKARTSFTIGGNLARVVVHKRPWIAYSKPIWAYRGIPVGLQPPVGVMFESPFRVIRCLRRKIRRNVIFALRKFRKGAGAKHRRRNYDSNIRC